MTRDNTDPPNTEQLATEIEHLNQHLNRLQFWGDTTTRQLEKLAELIAEQETK